MFRELKIPRIVPLFWVKDDDMVRGASLWCESESIDQGSSYSEKSVNISHCSFSRSSFFSGNGGVICVNGGSYSMNVDYSMFYNCFAQTGGAILFISLNSYLRMICANSCSCEASNGGHFAVLNTNQMNQVEYLSVSNCCNITSAKYPFYMLNGYLRVDNTNSSFNKAKQVSGIGVSSPSSFTSFHSTFSNNNSSECICIALQSALGAISFFYTNIVHNNSPSQFGVVYTHEGGSKKMKYCIFQNNQNYLFCVYSSSLEVSHSFIDHSTLSFSYMIPVSTATNNSFIKKTTYHIQFFNSHHCITDIPERTNDIPKNISTSNSPWIIYSIVCIMFVTLIAFLCFYRSIATNLLTRHQLEDSLQCDFG